MSHFFYLARCRDGSLYAGTCMDVKEREEKHNAGKGAKYTRSRLPVEIVCQEKCATLSEARKREAMVKKWRKKEKEFLVRKNPPHPPPERSDRSDRAGSPLPQGRGDKHKHRFSFNGRGSGPILKVSRPR